MAEASVQGRIHSVSREGNASAQARTKPATAITPTNAKKRLSANPLIYGHRRSNNHQSARWSLEWQHGTGMMGAFFERSARE
jgi:hypothetical protein